MGIIVLLVEDILYFLFSEYLFEDLFQYEAFCFYFLDYLVDLIQRLTGVRLDDSYGVR